VLAVRCPCSESAARLGRMDPPPDHGEHSYRGSGGFSAARRPSPAATPEWDGPRQSHSRAKARSSRSTTFQAKSLTRQVIDLIKAEERKGLALPGDIRDETFCQELVRRGRPRAWWAKPISSAPYLDQCHPGDDGKAIEAVNCLLQPSCVATLPCWPCVASIGDAQRSVFELRSSGHLQEEVELWNCRCLERLALRRYL
jgi:hypothetical protein